MISPEDKKAIEQAIHDAELLTSGEIRVHLDEKCKEDVMDHAAWLFTKLGMQKTAERNGVLIYLALADHKFAILGDKGIHERVGQEFWDDVKENMLHLLRKGLVTEAIVSAVIRSGEKLKEYFPRSADDVNELSNEVTFGKGGKS